VNYISYCQFLFHPSPVHALGCSYVVALVDVKVGIQVSLVAAVDGTSNAGPCLLEGENALNIVAVKLLSRDRVNDGGLNTEEG
jgi:hypothetical protein